MVPFVLILMGPPGVGKGTHAAPLSVHLKIPHISTGDLFRAHIRNLTKLGMEANKYIENGCLVPDMLVTDMLFSRIQEGDCIHGFILDGFPRTIEQSKKLDIHLGQNYRKMVIHLKLEDRVIIERVTGRISCKNCSQTYHLQYHPPKLRMICDHCHSSLYQRGDDQLQTIRKRLEIYQKETEPLIAYYKGQKEVFHEVDSIHSREKVFQNILDAPERN